MLAGIFLIAIPISAYISTLAHCLLGPPWNIALQGAIIAFAIGIFIGFCGECCVWLFILIGAFLGVVATLIYSYWGGFPQCWWQGLIALLGFVGLGVGMAIDCARRASASGGSGSSASSSSGLMSGMPAPRLPGRDWGIPIPTTFARSGEPPGAANPPSPSIPAPAPPKPAQPMAGLGDAVSRITEAFGVRPCLPCQKRAEQLNRLFPFPPSGRGAPR